jgi:acyl carrier protein
MTRNEIENAVVETIEEQTGLDKESIALDSDLESEYGLDSLDCAELLMELEGKFDVLVPDNKIDDIKTARDVVDVIDGLINN